MLDKDNLSKSQKFRKSEVEKIENENLVKTTQIDIANARNDLSKSQRTDLIKSQKKARHFSKVQNTGGEEFSRTFAKRK